MLDTILSALLPMVFTFVLGFVAARRHDFGSKDASTLNRMVLLYAVPMALFAGTVTTSRAALSRDIPLVIALGRRGACRTSFSSDREERHALRQSLLLGSLFPRRIDRESSCLPRLGDGRPIV